MNVNQNVINYRLWRRFFFFCVYFTLLYAYSLLPITRFTCCGRTHNKMFVYECSVACFCCFSLNAMLFFAWLLLVWKSLLFLGYTMFCENVVNLQRARWPCWVSPGCGREIWMFSRFDDRTFHFDVLGIYEHTPQHWNNFSVQLSDVFRLSAAADVAVRCYGGYDVLLLLEMMWLLLMLLTLLLLLLLLNLLMLMAVVVCVLLWCCWQWSGCWSFPWDTDWCVESNVDSTHGIEYWFDVRNWMLIWFMELNVDLM